MLLSAFKFKAFSIALHSLPVPRAPMALVGGKQKAGQKVVTRAPEQRLSGRRTQAAGTRSVVRYSAAGRFWSRGDCLSFLTSVFSREDSWRKEMGQQRGGKKRKQRNTTEANLRGFLHFLPPSGVHRSSATNTENPENTQTKPPIRTSIGILEKFQGDSGQVGIRSVKPPKEAALDEKPWPEPPACLPEAVGRRFHRPGILGRRKPTGVKSSSHSHIVCIYVWLSLH